MNSRVFLVEPKQLSISRIVDDGSSKSNKIVSNKFQDNEEAADLIRSAGDGMEFENNSETSLSSFRSTWQPSKLKSKPLATSTPSNRKRREKQTVNSKNVKEAIEKVKKSDAKSQVVENSSSDADQDISKELQELKLKLEVLEEGKQKLIEEKMKVSRQLGVQTQVNTELKTLLVASVGEDLEERLEKMTLDHALTERQMKRLQNQLDEKQEELEIAVIQSDVWRSKFLASKVMSDELASWKALSDSRYRESNAALETLLEEHRQLTTTIASANRFLLKLSKLTKCCPVDETPVGYSSIDLAIMNHSLAKMVTENIINRGLEYKENESYYPSQCPNDTNDRRLTLSLGEKRATKAIEEAKNQDPHADRRKKDFLAHSRISQILATRYPMTCLVCKGCKGTLKIV